MERIQLWSNGGGVQSAAIAGLIVTGKLPRPDYAVIIDTEREKQSTWVYLDSVIRPELARVGLEVHRVPKSAFATVDLYGKNGDLLLPAFTTQSGELGKLNTYCSNEWKQRCSKRWAKSIGLTYVENWLGISADEVRRVRNHDSNWWHLRFPLVFDVRMTRRECVALVESLGWPPAPRSACWMCSNMGNPEWLEIKTNRPAEFHKAVQLDKSLRARDPHIYLHSSGKPLDEVDLSADESQGNLFENTCTQCMI
jgi:hypothetical protein